MPKTNKIQRRKFFNSEYLFIYRIAKLLSHQKSERIWHLAMDAWLGPWHSHSMQARYAMRRLLLTLVLSQALACQALVAAWSGALAIWPHAAGTICSGMSVVPDGSQDDPWPAMPSSHQDCPGVCTAACYAANLPGQSLALARSGAPAAIQPSYVAALLEKTEAPGFLARAPPALT